VTRSIRLRGGRARNVEILSSPTRVAFGRRVGLGGQLTSVNGTPLANAAILVLEHTRDPNGDWTPVAALTTSATGAFSYVAPAGVSRVVRFRYVGTPIIRAVDTDVALQVAAASSFHASRHLLRNGQGVRFFGRLPGGHVPAGGKLVELQVLLRGVWQTFATPHSDRSGRWRYGYRFGARLGRVAYRFRVQIPTEATYPYDTGFSRPLKIVVTG
jgi:hypothetical protein